MSDYGFVHDGKVYTPNGSDVPLEQVEQHNAEVEASELEYWRTQPDHMVGYMLFPMESAHTPGYGPCAGGRAYRAEFRPWLTDAIVTTWRGPVLGVIVAAKVYTHPRTGRMVSVQVEGNNGARYYGRASWDWGMCVRLHKGKGKR